MKYRNVLIIRTTTSMNEQRTKISVTLRNVHVTVKALEPIIMNVHLH
jgi:hypothetical protein